jgi:large subunit ribosomal protein L19e
MNLSKKKALAARTLKVGIKRIEFVNPRLDEIKEVITKQDIRDLHKEGAIKVRPVSGRKKSKRKSLSATQKRTSRGPGKVRKKVNVRKKNYVTMTRKLRSYTAVMHTQGRISKEDLIDIRKKIRNKIFKSKAALKIYIDDLGGSSKPGGKR